MKTTKLNFTIPEDIAEALRARVSRRKRSAFVSEAVLEKLRALEQLQLAAALRDGYEARQTEDAEVDKEWEAPTLEEWN